MARIATLARRTFLIGTAAVAGGLAIGTIAYRRDPKNPLRDGLADGQATLNPYVRIDADGITLITPRADLGQGAVSVQAALLAEEMDLAWGQFHTEPGVPSAAYYNGKVLAEGLPIAATSHSVTARAGRQFGEVASKLMGLQLTGGSSTVPDAFDKLRVAGAVARQLLLAAAAERSGVPLAQLTTRDAAVLLPDGNVLPYTSLGEAAAKLTPPAEVALKPASQWRYLGKPLQRLDIVAKSTGTAVYGIDLRLPGMLYATVRSNPRRGGGMTSFDASAAQTARGVVKVVPLPEGFGVIADNTWRAFQAAAKVTPVWGPAPYPPDSAALFASVAASFTSDRRDSRHRDDGDVTAALQAAGSPGPKAAGSRLLQAEYRVPYLAHAPMEPMNAVVQLKDGRLDLWTGTQVPQFIVASAAKVAGIDEKNVHLHAQISGGSFGRRLEDDYLRQAVALAKAHPGVPIKMTWTREEDMTHDYPRPLAIARLRGVAGDGHVQACDMAVAMPSVTASTTSRLGGEVPGPDITIVQGAWDQPFALPHYRVTGYRAPATVPIASWRSVGASVNAFFHESFLDELIHAAGADPLAERLRLCTDPASMRVLQAVGQMSGWGTPLAADAAGGRRGRGLAFTLSFGVPVAEVVEVTATPEGALRIDNVFVACEVGPVLDPVNFENQVQGAVVWGLGHAMNCELTYADGMPQQTNFHAHAGMRLHQTPKIVVKALQVSGEIKGIGEPAVPPAAPALANAIFAATDRRLRVLPLSGQVTFL